MTQLEETAFSEVLKALEELLIGFHAVYPLGPQALSENRAWRIAQAAYSCYAGFLSVPRERAEHGGQPVPAPLPK